MSRVTLEQLEVLAELLSTSDRLKLAARLCEQTRAAAPETPPPEERQRREEEWQKLRDQLNAAAAAWEGKFDGVEELRQMRAERDEDVCPTRWTD